MKTFFKDVMHELEIRSGNKPTLTLKEKESLESILSDHEAGTLGTKFKQRQRRKAKIKPILESESTIESVDLLKKYYSDTKLHLDSTDALQLIEKGYKKGATYSAPGNAGGAFNETLSNEGVLLVEKYNIPLNELALVLYYRTLNTVLGKQQKDVPRNGIAIPNEVPRVHQNLYISSYLAAKSAIIKYNRSVIGTSVLEKTRGFKMESRMGYGGSSADLKELSNKIISANVCYIYDVDLNKVVEIPRLQMVNWSNSAGGKDNAGDTVIVVMDKDGNILYDGWSDKKSLNDIQANGTLNADFTQIINRINGFTELNMIDPKISTVALQLVTDYQNEVSEIEKGYKNAAIGEATYFHSLSKKEKETIAMFMDMQESYYKRNKTSNHLANSKKADGFGDSRNIDYVDYLMTEGVHKSVQRRKVINRIANMARQWYKHNKLEIPFELDTNGIISAARKTAMNKHSECIIELNKYDINYHGTNISLGNALSFYDVIDMLHISKIEIPTDDSDFNQYLKRNTNIIMGGVQITPELIKLSLGISNLRSYISEHKLVMDERLMYDNSKKYVTGKIVQLCSVSPSGDKIAIGQKVYRSKTTFAGKTDNTIIWSNQMQELFKKSS